MDCARLNHPHLRTGFGQGTGSGATERLRVLAARSLSTNCRPSGASPRPLGRWPAPTTSGVRICVDPGHAAATGRKGARAAGRGTARGAGRWHGTWEPRGPGARERVAHRATRPQSAGAAAARTTPGFEAVPYGHLHDPQPGVMRGEPGGRGTALRARFMPVAPSSALCAPRSTIASILVGNR